MASYTANLANFFISSSKPEVDIVSINDVFTNQMSLCIRDATVFHVKLQNRYREGTFITSNSTEDLFEYLNIGKCDVSLMHTEEWRTCGKDERYNKDCSLHWVGRIVESRQSGFAVKDLENDCTSLLKNVLNRIIFEMKIDNILEKVLQSYRSSVAESTCDMETAQQNSETFQLSPTQLGGAFAFHSILVFVSILFAIFEFNHQPNNIKQQIRGSLLTSFQEAITNPTKGFNDEVEEERVDGQNSRKFSTALAPLNKVHNFCSNLSSFDANNLIFQNQIMFMQKVHNANEIEKRNLDLFSKKFVHTANKQDKRIKELKKKILKLESLMEQKCSSN